MAPEQTQVVQQFGFGTEGGRHNGHEAVFEVDLVGAEGRRSTFEIVTRQVVENGASLGLHAIGRDISERRERERATIRFREQLHQAEKLRALGGMAAGVAHNFNNLLTVVLGNAELISMREDFPEHIRTDMELILESARRCSGIVRRIQTFGRPIDIEETSQVNINQLLREVVDITRPKWKTVPKLAGSSVRIAFDLQDDIPLIESQGAAWEEIVSNLIFNAVDALPDGGLITLSSRHDGGDVTLAVADNGTGMDEETRRRVFEPFFTTKDPERGTGLGLSSVWGLVQTLGGNIAVETTLGEGTTFSVSVPSALKVEQEAAAPDVEATSGLDVLIVDDEVRVLELLPPLLTRHRVEAVNSGLEGLERARSQRYDVVISDWVMAEASGLEIAEAVKQVAPDSVVILMTGWQFKREEVDPHSRVDLLLAKPFEREDVERVMRDAALLRDERRDGAS